MSGSVNLLGHGGHGTHRALRTTPSTARDRAYMFREFAPAFHSVFRCTMCPLGVRLSCNSYIDLI